MCVVFCVYSLEKPVIMNKIYGIYMHKYTYAQLHSRLTAVQCVTYILHCMYTLNVQLMISRMSAIKNKYYD